MSRKLVILVFCFFSLNLSAVNASESLPDDVRYMLEDLYGANKSAWPAQRYKSDLNKDGFADWVVTKNNCASTEQCPADIFICVPDKKGGCSEYCYQDVKTLKNIKEQLSKLKCEATC